MVDVIRGKYQIVREIARSNDIVYEALDLSLGRRIAIKELCIPHTLTGAARDDRVARFNREARAAGRLSHPNIVSVFDFGEEDGRHFIAMEFLEGQSLRDILQIRGNYPLQEALEIATLVLSALAYAHANGVVHRDIKPDNIQILPGGQVKLTDFGIARLTEEPALTANGQVFGTPSYMSPEQIEGREIDHRTDIFSLGVVLYEMLAGRKPFTGDSVVSITYAIMNASPPQLAGVPMGIEQVIRRALSKDPNHRQVSADQMKQDLRNAGQTPAAFFSPGQVTGTGFGSSSLGQPLSPVYPDPASGSYAGGWMSGPPPVYPGMTGNVQPQSVQPTPLNAPWTWNSSAQAAPTPPQAQGRFTGALPGGIGPPINVPPAFPAYGAEPLFTLSPGGKTFLLSVIAAAVLGGFIATSVILFLRGYDHYRTRTAVEQVSGLINQGWIAYNESNYQEAARLFEQALNAGPLLSQREQIRFNLVATYIHLARKARENREWKEAQRRYKMALALDSGNALAHTELAVVLDHLGAPQAAQSEREQAHIAGDPQPLPVTLTPYSAPRPETYLSPNSSSGQSSEEFLNSRRTQAQQLIAEGLQMEQQGDLSGAHRKWREAIATAPGTPEREKAAAHIERTQNTPNFDR